MEQPPNDLETGHPYWFGSLTSFFAAASICAALYCVLVTKSLPTQDDFCRAAAVPVTNYPPKVFPVGIIVSVVWSYHNWSARWAGIGLETLLLRFIRLPEFYPVLLLLLAVIQGLVLYLAVKQFFTDTRSALFLTVLVGSIYWANMPGLGEGFFWLPAVVEYQLALALTILVFSLLAPSRARKSSNVWRITIGCLLAFLIPAFHELLGAVVVLLASVVVVVLMLQQRPEWKSWLAIWVAAAIGFLIVFAAPANAIRGIHLTHRAIVRTTLLLSLEELRYSILPWCLDLKLWLLAILLWADPHFASVRRRMPHPSFSFSIGIVFGVWMLILMLAISAPIWQLGYQSPARVMNVVYGLFLTGWIAIVFLLTKPLLSFPVHPVHRAAMCSAALILLSFQIVANHNNLLAASDIYRGRLKSWNTQLNQRFHMLRSARPDTEVRLERLSTYPRTFEDWDITEDPAMWSNRCLAEYFGVASVALESPR